MECILCRSAAIPINEPYISFIFHLPCIIKLPRFLDETVSALVLEQFKAEAEIWNKLKHKNIVRFYTGDIRPVPYLVIELMDGGSLKQLMENHKFSITEAIEIMLQVLDGMSYAHKMASVHRDIKPENILFTSKGDPYWLATLEVLTHL